MSLPSTRTVGEPRNLTASACSTLSTRCCRSSTPWLRASWCRSGSNRSWLGQPSKYRTSSLTTAGPACDDAEDAWPVSGFAGVRCPSVLLLAVDLGDDERVTVRVAQDHLLLRARAPVTDPADPRAVRSQMLLERSQLAGVEVEQDALERRVDRLAGLGDHQ